MRAGTRARIRRPRPGTSFSCGSSARTRNAFASRALGSQPYTAAPRFARAHRCAALASVRAVFRTEQGPVREVRLENSPLRPLRQLLLSIRVADRTRCGAHGGTMVHAPLGYFPPRLRSKVTHLLR